MKNKFVKYFLTIGALAGLTACGGGSGGSGGSSMANMGVGAGPMINGVVTPEPINPGEMVLFVLQHGQSLTQGVTASPAVLTAAGDAYTVDYGDAQRNVLGFQGDAIPDAVGLAQLQEFGSDTGMTAMTNAIDYDGEIIFANLGRGASSIEILSADNFMTNFRDHLTDMKTQADGQQWDIDDQIVVMWRQGQSDGQQAEGGYKDQMEAMFGQVGAIANDVLGPDANLLIGVTQQAGYGARVVPFDQFDFIAENNNVFFAGEEADYQITHPSSGTDGTHLNPEGYTLLGADAGQAISLALQGDTDVTRITDVKVSGTNLIVDFSAALVGDAGGQEQPFFIRSTQAHPTVTGWSVVDENTLQVNLDRAPAQGEAWRLEFGGGFANPAGVPFENVPMQYWDMDVSAESTISN